MSPTVNGSAVTTPDNRLVTARPKAAKAALHDNRGQDGASSLSGPVIEATKKSWVKQGAAAAVLGKDEGNFSRDVKAERLTLAQLRALGPEFLAAFGAELLEEYGQLADPKDYIYKRLRDVEEALHEFKQFLESRVA